MDFIECVDDFSKRFSQHMLSSQHTTVCAVLTAIYFYCKTTDTFGWLCDGISFNYDDLYRFKLKWNRETRAVYLPKAELFYDGVSSAEVSMEELYYYLKLFLWFCIKAEKDYEEDEIRVLTEALKRFKQNNQIVGTYEDKLPAEAREIPI